MNYNIKLQKSQGFEVEILSIPQIETLKEYFNQKKSSDSLIIKRKRIIFLKKDFEKTFFKIKNLYNSLSLV